MRTILLALMLGFIGINAHAGETAQEEAVKATPCANGVCRQPVRNTARVVLAAPVRVVQAGACIVKQTACAVKKVSCNVRTRVKARATCRQSRRAAFFSRRCCN